MDRLESDFSFYNSWNNGFHCVSYTINHSLWNQVLAALILKK